MSFSPILDELTARLRVLPGVGPKLAQRLALHLVRTGRLQAEQLQQSLSKALTSLGQCQQCFTLSESSLCHVCADDQRTQQQVCVVAEPADVEAMEQTGVYFGRYFVLNGLLSPIDGIGPAQLQIPQLLAQHQQQPLVELILALNPSPEGLATSSYLAQVFAELGVPVSQLAQGLPMGGRIDAVDASTLEQALSHRAAWRNR